jgi:hypothetical protein
MFMKKMLLYVTLLLVLLLSNTILADAPLPEPTQRPDAYYRLFRTTNLWTFIKLDTRDGRMWQVQFNVQGDNRGIAILNDQPLIDAKDRIPGRFTLYPTTNLYTFILLDQIDGRTWQVQWSTETNNRMVIPINEFFK